MNRNKQFTIIEKLCVEMKYSIACLEITKIVLNDVRLYNILTDKDSITPTRWSTDFGNVSKEDFRKYNSVITELHDVNLRTFNLK